MGNVIRRGSNRPRQLPPAGVSTAAAPHAPSRSARGRSGHDTHTYPHTDTQRNEKTISLHGGYFGLGALINPWVGLGLVVAGGAVWGVNAHRIANGALPLRGTQWCYRLGDNRSLRRELFLHQGRLRELADDHHTETLYCKSLAHVDMRWARDMVAAAATAASLWLDMGEHARAAQFIQELSRDCPDQGLSAPWIAVQARAARLQGNYAEAARLYQHTRSVLSHENIMRGELAQRWARWAAAPLSTEAAPPHANAALDAHSLTLQLNEYRAEVVADGRQDPKIVTLLVNARRLRDANRLTAVRHYLQMLDHLLATRQYAQAVAVAESTYRWLQRKFPEAYNEQALLLVKHAEANFLLWNFRAAADQFGRARATARRGGTEDIAEAAAAWEAVAKNRSADDMPVFDDIREFHAAVKARIRASSRDELAVARALSLRASSLLADGHFSAAGDYAQAAIDALEFAATTLPDLRHTLASAWRVFALALRQQQFGSHADRADAAAARLSMDPPTASSAAPPVATPPMNHGDPPTDADMTGPNGHDRTPA